MSAQPNDITRGRRHRRDFLEKRWRFYSEKAQLYHDEWMEAERELMRAEMRRVPALAPPVRMEIVEDDAA